VAPGGTLPPLLAVGLRMMRRDDEEDDIGCSGTAGVSAGPVEVYGVAPEGTLPPLLTVGLRMVRMTKGAVCLRADQRALLEYAGWRQEESSPSVSGRTADDEEG
jgi:hypothetical protein